jgi:prolyl oligopeptidase
MRVTTIPCLPGALLASAGTPAMTSPDPTSDPYLWLEDVEGKAALDWVRARNSVTTDALIADPAFEPLRADLRAILDSHARIPEVAVRDGWYYNFWRDGAHPAGIWRRATLAEFRKPQPAWELLLDLDALNAAEKANFVWHGADCLKPDYTRCLVALSRGGADADETREFDITTKRFVAGGFFRPEAKGGLSWRDPDTVYVTTDFGAGSMTTSGYPRTARLWRRGTPMASAELVFEAQHTDLGGWAWRDHTEGFVRDFASRVIAFYNDELFLFDAGGVPRKLDLPNSASKKVHREWLTIELREPLDAGGVTHVPGSLLAIALDRFLAGARDWTVLFAPDEHSSLAASTWTRNHLLLNVLQDVKNRVVVLTPRAQGAWARAPLSGAPELGAISLQAVDAETSDAVLMQLTDYLTPNTLSLVEAGKPDAPEVLKQLPAFFDAEGLAASQHFATSKDGTKVPYFLVGPKDLPANGANPTLLYGYGGFEVSMLPNYSAGVGRGWLAQGGVFVVANIRGGGEYGPRWHRAALRENRNKAYEDFAAVSEDLIARGITAPKHLGIQGGSNGGLLMGNMLVMYPQLFGAVVCQVPLLDMQRYHKLLAGASWMAEYGDPDTPGDWAFLRRYSPYHNVAADAQYPKVLFTTSTRDDRVHPGHARKMMARMQDQGHDVLYYENIEGGHGGAANNEQAAFMQALSWTFLRRVLFAPTATASH